MTIPIPRRGRAGPAWQAAITLKNQVYCDTRDFSALFVNDTVLFAGTDSGRVWRRLLSEMPTGVAEDHSGVPTRLSLEQDYPNPFNPSTTIKYDLPKSTEVRLSVFDMLDREVSTLVDERREAGVHEIKFHSSGCASGVYIYRLQTGDLFSDEEAPSDPLAAGGLRRYGRTP